MWILTKFPLHAILFSVYPICYLYARNAIYIVPAHTMRPLAISLGVFVLLLIGFRLILRDWERAGLLASLIAVLFFSFGHVAAIIGPWMADQGLPYKEFYLGWVWLLVFLLLSLVIVQKGRSQQVTGFLNFASATLLVLSLVAAISVTTHSDMPSARELQALANLRGDSEAQPLAGAKPVAQMPDIYYIVLDGYERADILLESYDYDNSGFINALINRGFYVAGQSQSNYLSTNYSLSSSLNLAYFHDFPAGILQNARYNLQTNFVSDFLRERGYRVVVFDSGTGNTNDQYYDEFVTPHTPSVSQASEINPFEFLLLKTTLGRLLMARGGESADPGAPSDALRASVNQELTLSRERITHALTHLTDYAPRQGNYFLFSHIYLPHIPFLYGQAGEELEYHGDLSVNWYVVHPDEYTETYGYQLDYLNGAVLDTVDRILHSSKKPVMIILQADHGDSFMLDWENPSAQGVAARSSILNAIYYSDGSYEDLYQSMTPVNTFRLAFNHWFGTRYPLLQDKTFFHGHPATETYGAKLEFIDACKSYSVCSPQASEKGLDLSGSVETRP